MRIGELGRLSGLSRDTLRFYEKQGLLGKVPRGENGYRDYPPELKTKVDWITELKTLGLTISEIKELTNPGAKTESSCLSLRETLDQRLTILENSIRELERMRKTVKQQLNLCSENGPDRDCDLGFCSEPDDRILTVCAN